MTWILVYNRTQSIVEVEQGRLVDANEFSYADDDLPQTQALLAKKILVDVPVDFDPATAGAEIDYEARYAAAIVVQRNGGEWNPPVPLPSMASYDELVAVVTELLASRGLGDGIPVLDGGGKLQEQNLPAHLIAQALTDRFTLKLDADRRGANSGVAGLTSQGKIYESNIVDRLTAAVLDGRFDLKADLTLLVDKADLSAGVVPDAQLPARLGVEGLSATTAPRAAGVAGFLAPTFSALTATTTIPVGVLADGFLYGYTAQTLKRSSDQGASWTTIRDLGADGGLIITILDTSGGEVLIVREQAIYRTSGWATNKATATVTLTLERPGLTSFYQWGVDTNPATGVCTAATYIGSTPYNDARYFWVSTNGGATWTVKYDINDHLAGVGGTLADSHTHLAKIDPWADDRLWISWHRSGVAGMGSLLYSDDLGDTWTKLATAQPTAAVATRRGMVFTTDESPNGVYVVSHTTNPADMEYQFAYRWAADTLSVAGFGQWATRSPDGERAYLAFIGDVGFKPILVQSDGIAASLMHESPDAIATSLGDGWRSIHYVDDTLIAVERRGDTYKTMTARRTVARLATVAPTADSGIVLGGTAHVQRSVAVGKATTSAARSVAVGDLASATSTDTASVGSSAAATGDASTALGASSAASGTSSTAVGKSATASNARSVAVGRLATASSTDTVALGNAATASGSGATASGASALASGTNSSAYGFGAVAAATDATALGKGSSATGTNGTAVGDAATADASNATSLGKGAAAGAASVSGGQGATSGASSVALGQGSVAADLQVVVGHGANGGTGAYGTVLGELALISGATQYGTALGRAANVASGHSRSVALGSTTTTTTNDQVQTGGRHFEFSEVVEPAAPAADALRFYGVDNGGQTELRARFNGGQAVTLAIQAGLTRLTPKTTVQRPNAATVGPGAAMFDTTLGKPIYCTGSAWVDATGAAA